MITIPGTINQAVAALAGFTSATFTTASSATTFPNGKTYIVTNLGGTQPSSVDAHSASRPFSFLVTKPPIVRRLPAVNSAGILPNVPLNVYGLHTLKGLTTLAGQASVNGYRKVSYGIPAGADLADPDNIAAMLLASIMAEAQLIQGILDTAVSGEV
jgi:hypothetical protein